MSTNGIIDPRTAPSEVSHIRASAITLSCSSDILHNPSMDELYQLSCQQPTCIETNVPMADPASAGLSEGNDKVLVTYTGQDTARSAWARLIVPQPEELRRNPELLDTKDRIERLTREVNFQLMQKPLVHSEVYFSRNPNFMGKINFIAPREYAKLAFDLNLNFIRRSLETDALYEQSKPLSLPDLWLVCHPEWVNPVWEAWRHRVRHADPQSLKKDPEPKRIMMIFDIANYTAYLLGARYFGESKKACLTMIWDAAINSGLGMPIHGSSKTLYVSRQLDKYNGNNLEEALQRSKSRTGLDRKRAMTFITIGLSGSGKSTIGNDSHKELLLDEHGEHVRIGNDDALVILYEPDDHKQGTVGLEHGSYNKSNDYTPDSDYIKTVQSAENVMVVRDRDRQRILVHEDTLNGNGRVQTARHMLEGAELETLDTPWPNYISLLMKDETLPPLCCIENPQLIVSMYMCLASRSTTAENIPVDQMNRLKMVPGANPFNTWGLQQEASSLERLLERVNSRGLILNTGGFFINAAHNEQNQTRKVPKELSLSIYPMLARKQIKWVEWKHFPGLKVPAPGTFKNIYPTYDQEFSPDFVSDRRIYFELLRERLQERREFLMALGIDQRYVLPIRKAILQLDMENLSDPTRTHVDNLDTLMPTGRDHSI
jgi:ATP-dependent phosphoenolpyruvate carboxykinase